MEDNTVKVILAILTIIATVVGGALISIRKTKKRNTKSNQENININGDGNKIIGGDDNSKN
tara:strand:+ start:105 stop:287 length:183 start_codon:yes stop_codon:yes gene_type:complete